MESTSGPGTGNSWEHQRWQNDTRDLLTVGSFLRIMYVRERGRVELNAGKYTVAVALGIAPWVRTPDQPPAYQS